MPEYDLYLLVLGETPMRPFICALAILCLSSPVAVLAETPASPTTSAALAAPSAATTAMAKDWLHRLQTASIDRAQLDAAMNAALTDQVATQFAARYGPLGDPTDFTFVETKAAEDYTAYTYRVTFKSTTLSWVFAQDTAGKIGGLRLTPLP
jgi:hypothetical protein